MQEENAPPASEEEDDADLEERQRPYYVYMMRGRENFDNTRKRRRKTKVAEEESARTESDPESDASSTCTKIYTHVGKSRQPIKKVLRHNRQSVRHVTNKKLMSRVARNWRLEEWFGPFHTRENARTFQRTWCMHIRRSLPPPQPEHDSATHYSARAPISEQRVQQAAQNSRKIRAF